ncbi:predicted protein [Lichtheimia corymbifera JMRC:FSU:9682]|uniref:RBR-type E3 ubiquitin transferase n=1 Tax=Lichtheimia corymbifera JMRC:FSU:9682 TaxID=1263082 RepID=A0A068SEN3_9FUNG|nr:predicted protein [Lichtheimia corymbifera JMRC:FSU:9682]
MFRFLSSRESNPSSEIDHCCIVCFDDENELTFTTDKCNHHVCQECMVQYLRTYLDKGSSIMRDYETIPCPQLKCNQEFQAATIIDLVMPSHEQAATWWQKLIKKTTIDNLETCPYDDVCKAVFEVLPEELGEATTFTECLECHRGICMQCGNKWHEGDCKNKRWARVTLPKDQKEAAIRRKNSMELRKVAKNKGWSRCPRCHHMVERIAGCNYVRCRCGTGFCYRCGSLRLTHGNNGCNVCSTMQPTALQAYKDENIYQYEAGNTNV